MFWSFLVLVVVNAGADTFDSFVLQFFIFCSKF